MDLLVGFHLHFARNGMLKHPIPYIGMDAQANLTVGSGEKRLSFRSSENKSQTVVATRGSFGAPPNGSPYP